jgi:tellurite resistance protein
MAQAPKSFRPKSFPPPEFPPRRPRLFARTPPAIFPALLGLMGLVLAMRRVSDHVTGIAGGVDLAAGLVAGLWLFCTLAYAVKIARRPAVVPEDLKILPGRAGLSSATMTMMALAALLVTVAPGTAKLVLVLALILHFLLALLILRGIFAGPPEARDVTPAWHLHFVGFIVAAVAAVPLGWTGLATGLLYALSPVALAIWMASLLQILRRVPPAPLRPLLAIHLAPASLLSSVAGLLGQPLLAGIFLAIGAALLLGLLLAARWITLAGFGPLWGAFTFPLGAYASALLINGWVMAGGVLAAAALGVVPVIAWRVLSMWPNGKLAAKTNAAEA